MEIMFVKEVNKGAFKCTVDVKIPAWGNFIIRRIKIFEKGSDMWMSFPSETYEKDGKTQYFSYNMFEDIAMTKKFEEKLIALLKERKPGLEIQNNQPKFSTAKAPLEDKEIDFIL